MSPGTREVVIGALGPTDLVVVVAALGIREEWFAADEIRHALRAFGHDVRTQQVAAWLGRMAREDLPRFERRDVYGQLGYRATRYARERVRNELPGLAA